MRPNPPPKPKKPAKKDKYNALIIAIDCGANMRRKESGSMLAFHCAKDTVDWIVTRKIFTQSNDHVNIVQFGARGTKNCDVENIVVNEECLTPASFDHLKFLQKEVVQTGQPSRVVDALIVAVDAMKNQTDGDANVESRNILIVSNGAGYFEEDDERLEPLVRAINVLEINVTVMGLNPSLDHRSVRALKSFVERVDGTSMSFADASQVIHNFSQKPVASRASKKNWQILPDISLPLAFYMRSTPAKNFLKASAVNDKGEEVKRDVSYFVKKNPKDEFVEDEEMEVEGKKVDKSELVYGYLFGRSKIVLSDDDMAEYKGHNFNEGEKGGCLKLLQFTQRSNIPPSFFMGTSSYTVLPTCDAKKPSPKEMKLMNVTLSLIESMLQQDTVAICRYAYHASANLQLMALLPRKDPETGTLYMTGIRLPFLDDWRPFSLPDVLGGSPISPAKLRIMDLFIDAMDLTNSDISYDKVMNPFFQRECALMKLKAMKDMGCAGEDDEIQPSLFLKRSLEPDRRAFDTKQFKEAPEFLRTAFPLQEIIKQKRPRREYSAQNKDHLRGFDEADEEEDDETVKDEIVPIIPNPEGPLKKYWEKVREAAQSGGSINSWKNLVATDMMCFDEGFTATVEKFKILRLEMLAAGRVAEFNQWLMSFNGNDEYSDFFHFMERQNELSLITLDESADSWYTTTESEMFWSGMLEEEKK